jgi:hypothetical protein
MDRQILVDTLRSGVHHVTFTKVDGSERTMPCTLDESVIPPPADPVTDRAVPRKLNLDTLRVFVTDIQQWRSFRIENLIKIESTQ